MERQEALGVFEPSLGLRYRGQGASALCSVRISWGNSVQHLRVPDALVTEALQVKGCTSQFGGGCLFSQGSKQVVTSRPVQK